MNRFQLITIKTIKTKHIRLPTHKNSENSLHGFADTHCRMIPVKLTKISLDQITTSQVSTDWQSTGTTAMHVVLGQTIFRNTSKSGILKFLPETTLHEHWDYWQKSTLGFCIDRCTLG